ncbi:MAG: PD40 domain-containing protein, partial [Planctomycetales bacterium]|nr:PD40 domain-containing protein [Planctomycetales bacterium]
NLSSLELSPSGDHLAIARRYGERIVVDREFKNQFDYDRIANGSLGTVAWNQDGTQFASADSHSVAVYQRDVAEPVCVFRHQEVDDVCWIDDNTIASCGSDHVIRIWDTEKQNARQAIQISQTPVVHVNANYNGELVSVYGANEFKVIRLSKVSGYRQITPVEKLHRGTSNSVRWSPSGRLLASAHTMQTDSLHHATEVRVIDVAHEQLVGQCEAELGPAIDWSADGKCVEVIDRNGSISQFTLLTSSKTKVRDFELNLFRTHSLAVNHRLGLVAFAHYIDSNAEEPIKIVDISTKELKKQIELPKGYWSAYVSWSPDGEKLAVVYERGGDVHCIVYNQKTCTTQSATLSPHGLNTAIRWNPTSDCLAIGWHEGIIQTIEVDSLERRHLLSGHQSPIHGITWAPEGTRMASCGSDGTVRIWDTIHGEELIVFTLPHQPNLWSIDWDPTGGKIAAGTTNGEIYILDAGPSMAPED